MYSLPGGHRIISTRPTDHLKFFYAHLVAKASGRAAVGDELARSVHSSLAGRLGGEMDEEDLQVVCRRCGDGSVAS